MNRRDTQMLAHEMALYQRARAPGGNNSPTFQHPPGVQVPHSSNILTPRPAWTGGPLMGHVPQAMGVQQHPSHGHANGPGGLPRQPQPQYLQVCGMSFCFLVCGFEVACLAGGDHLWPDTTNLFNKMGTRCCCPEMTSVYRGQSGVNYR